MWLQNSNFFSNKLAVVLAVTCQSAVFALFLLLAPHTFAPAHAAQNSGSPQQPVVVELFTSEGCSSCPPADALLAQLDASQGAPGSTPVIVLSEHVTYWNDLGWHDPYSSQTFTERQNQYGSRFGLQSVYTPQAVVDGSQELVGSDRSRLINAIRSAAGQPKIPLSLENIHWSGDSVTAQISATSDTPAATLFAALADDSDKSSVLHGENQGRDLRHVAVVRTLLEVRKTKGALNQQPIQVRLPAGVQPQSKMRLVVFLADNRTGRILGATMHTLER